jgi:type VI secretion system protein ImpH
VESETGNETLSLSADLEARPESFGYFQALRLLYWANRYDFKSFEDFIRRGVFIRGDASLSFPGTDLVECQKTLSPFGGETPAPERGFSREEDPLYRLTVTFMGLYGAASPLPPFYAREILQDTQNDLFATRELLDLFAFPLFQAHALAYFKKNLGYRVLWDEDSLIRDILSRILGKPFHAFRTEGNGLWEGQGDLGFISYFASPVRHALGLTTYLSSQPELARARLRECVLRWVEIPPSQRTSLGRRANVLGESALLGGWAQDYNGKFKLTVPVRDWETLEGFAPGGPTRLKLESAVAQYVDSPLLYDLELILEPGVARGAVLGQGAGRLGLSAFLSPRAGDATLRIVEEIEIFPS